MAGIEPEGSTTRKDRGPSFFKVLIGDSLTKLWIPPKFSKLLESIPNQTFQVWNSARVSWSVRIERDQNIMCLTEGWAKFVQDNALEFGDFLVFSYSGISDFDVPAYGKHCCEKNAVVANKKKTKPSFCEGDQNKVDQLVGNNQRHGTDVEMIDMDSDSNTENEINMTSLHDQQQSLGRKASQEKSKALEGSGFVSKYPSFQIRMQKTYVQKGFLNLPKGIMMKYFKGAQQNVTLRMSKKTWSVKMAESGYNLRLLKGWQAFVKSNALKLDDICIFEVLEGTAIELQVNVLRA